MSEETGRSSNEDRFLGVRTTIDPPEPESAEPEVAEVDIEVVDDRPEEDQRFASATGDEDELADYGTKVQKRINKLKKQFHDERRAKESSERLSNEAVNYTQQLQIENQRLVKLVQDSQSALTQQAKNRADNQLLLAEENFKKAHASGDADAIAEAQKNLTNAQLAQAYAPSVSRKIIEKWKQDVMSQQDQQESQQPYDPAPIPEPDPKAVEWQGNNEWFGTDTEMTSFAYGVHERLVNEGIDPDSDEYYKLIDKRMGEVFPSHFGGDTQVSVEAASTRKRANPVVAPASRNSGGAIQRKVQLTQTQVRLAKRLGLTPQQYATQLMKEMV